MKKILIISVVLLFVKPDSLSAQTEIKTTQKDFTISFNAYIRKMMEKIPAMPNYDKQLQDLADGYEIGKRSIQASAAERSKRLSQLSMQPDKYTGKYMNDYFGTIEVLSKNNILAIKMGSIYCVSTPFTEKESIRVEMIPGSGEVIRFKKNGADNIESLNYGGVEFVKGN